MFNSNTHFVNHDLLAYDLIIHILTTTFNVSGRLTSDEAELTVHVDPRDMMDAFNTAGAFTQSPAAPFAPPNTGKPEKANRAHT